MEDQGLGMGVYRFRDECIGVPALDYQGSRSILVKKHSRDFQCGFLWFFGSMMFSFPNFGLDSMVTFGSCCSRF